MKQKKSSQNTKTKKSNDECYYLYKSGKYDEAWKCFEGVLKKHPTNIAALYGKGISLRKLGKYDEAWKCFDELLQLKLSKDMKIKALNGKGWIKYDLGEYTEAIKCFNEALDIDPNNSYALNGKGYSYLYLKKYNEALNCFNKLPNNALALHGKGWIQSINKKYEEAVKYFEKAWETDDKFYGVIKSMQDYMACLKKKKKVDAKIEKIFEKLRKIAFYIIAFKCPLVVNEKIVYHYTNPEVIKNILESENHYFRLYNTHYMNDPYEGRTFLKMILNEDLKCLMQVYNIKNEGDVNNFIRDNKIQTFIGSFVIEGDNLFLWRTYGKDSNKEEAKGVSIGIKRGFFDDIPDHFETFKNEELFCLYYVVYESDNNYKELTKILLEINNIAKDLLKTATRDDEKEFIKTIINLLLDEIRYLVKSKHYKEEKECRIIKDYNLEIHNQNIKLDKNHTPPKLYIDIEKDLTNYINKVVLGSRLDNPESWETYLNYHLYNKDVIINSSTCNFR
jgi:tetratricopeptide (TPR) repeat protein